LFLIILIATLFAVYLIFFIDKYPPGILSRSLTIGDSVDSYNGIVVYNNGPDYPKSHGKHYTKDSSFYYGKKWQCVEYIKRYYYDHFHFQMPDGMGNAKDFFKPGLKQGALNKQRGLLQFENGGDEPPAVNDILIFGGKYGHVAIVTSSNDHEIEVIQQNIYLTPREKFCLRYENGVYTVGDKKKPNGWLRLP
jgi:hypothetical protein